MQRAQPAEFGRVRPQEAGCGARGEIVSADAGTQPVQSCVAERQVCPCDLGKRPVSGFALTAKLYQTAGVDFQPIHHDRMKRPIQQESDVGAVWCPVYVHEPGQGFTERAQPQTWEVYGDETSGELARPDGHDFSFRWVECRRRCVRICDFLDNDLHLSPTPEGSDACYRR